MPALEVSNLSRKERRKIARKAKKARQQAWSLHQVKKEKKDNLTVQHTHVNWSSSKIQSTQQTSPLGGKRVHKKKRPRTKFEEFLEFEKNKTANLSAEDDLALERQLAKRLKVKDGRFGGTSDGLFDLLEGTVSAPEIQANKNKETKSMGHAKHEEEEEEESGEEIEDSDEEDDGSDQDVLGDMLEDDGENDGLTEEDEEEQMDEDWDGEEEDDSEENGGDEHQAEDNVVKLDNVKRSGQEASAVGRHSSAKYVAPHRRVEDASNEASQIERRTRGLLNKLSEENVELISQELLTLFQAHGRRIMTRIVTSEIMEAMSSGPRGNEQYAAVFAAFVAGLGSSIGMDFGAKFLASLAQILEEQRSREDSLAIRNLVLLLSYLYTFKLVACDVIYDLLFLLSKSLTELDVSTILTFLQTCGMALRADDPTAMKDFVLSVQHRFEELKAAAVQSGTIFCMGKRMEFMLETICEIKNNKRRGRQEAVPHVRMKKWLQKLGIEEVHLRGLKWKKLLDLDKKGQWWISGEIGEHEEAANTEVTEFIRKETSEADKMLQLAASQKMNTDIRRAIFCVVMTGEDYLDAFEKILRIKLTGKQDREIMRVIVECCLQEKVFNKYYSLLIVKLCHHDKNHKFTLQYCFWDHFKQLSSMETRRLANLAHLLADLIANFSLSLSVLKVVEFTDTKTMTPKVVLYFCILFRVLLTGYSDEVVVSCFARIASALELEGFRMKLSVFLHQHLLKAPQTKGFEVSNEKDSVLLLKRFAMVKKSLATSSIL